MNPATRLHAILKRIKSDSGKNRPLRQAIAEMFGLSDASSPEVIRHYANMVTLVLDVESRIKAIPNLNHDLYTRGVKRILNRFATANLDTDLHSFRNQVTDEDMHALEFVFDMLDSFESEKEISDATLKALLEKADALLEELKAADVEPDFRRFLFSHLSAVRAAIQNYRFFGAAGMRGAVSKAVGEMILDPRDLEKAPKNKTFFRRTLEVMKDVNAVITFMRTGKEVASQIPFEEILRIHG